MQALFRSFAKTAGYGLAALILVAALAISVARLVTPILNQHKIEFEKIASQFLRTPVSIKNVKVSWYQYQPVISLRGLTLHNKESRKPLLKIKNINILMSIPESIWKREIVTSGMLVSGVHLNIEELAKGKYSVQELSSLNLTPHQETTNPGAILLWLSNENHLILRNIDLNYTSLNGKKSYFTLSHANVENNGLEHKISGKAILHQALPTEVTVAGRWTGQTFNKIKGDFYLYVSGLSFVQWAKDYVWKDWQVKDGIVSAKIWGTLTQGRIQKVQSHFQLYDVSLYSKVDKSTHEITRLSGNLGWKQEGNEWILAGDDILLDIPTHFWPVTNFYISLTRDAKGSFQPKIFNFSFLDLDDIQSYLMSSTLLSNDVKKKLSQLKLRGTLQSGYLELGSPWNDWEQIKNLNISFSNLNFAAWKKYPGMQNLSGFLKWNGKQGNLKLNSQNTIFRLPAIFSNDLTFDQLSGHLQLQYDANKNWLFNINSLDLLNKSLAANIKGDIKLLSDLSPVADISANFVMQRAKKVTHYLPNKIFDKDLVSWLKQAFLSGRVVSSHAVLRGPLKDFPFDQGNGEFSITSKIKNLNFRFSPNWPIIQKVNGLLTFNGRKMNVDIDNARMMGIPLTGIHGVIPYLGDSHPQILHIKADAIHSNFSHALSYIHGSPLEENIGKMFADVDMQGEVKLNLGLNIPLSDTDKTEVRGNLAFTDASMKSQPYNLQLNHLQGQVSFTENKTEAKAIFGELFNKPLQFDLATIKKSKNLSVVRAKFNYHMSLTDLENWLKLPASESIKGGAELNGKIDFALEAPLEIHLNSNLVGVTANLIEPYAKVANDAKNFSADITLQNNHPVRIKFNYDDFNAAIMLSRKQNQYELLAAKLGFGEKQVNWPDLPGIFISGNFDKIDLDQFKKTISENSSQSTLSKKLKEIDINANQVNVSGHTFTHVHLLAKNIQNKWTVNMVSPELTGQLTLPIPFNRESFITARIQKINLHASKDQTNDLLNVKTLPGIFITANYVRFNDMPLGRLIFKAIPSDNGLKIQILQIISQNMNLAAGGYWEQNDNHNFTHLKGHINSPNVSRLLKSLDMDVTSMVLNDGRLNFNLSWRDALYAPSLSSLNGQAAISLGSGRVIDIGKGGDAKMDIGRLLNIFNLQTLHRRLSLDFSDLYRKGYSFDTIRGDVTIRNGNLYTKNLLFDGPVAKVGINGRIGLEKKDYDFVLSVMANVTSSIPIAATLITGNPLIGLGAFAVNTVLNSQFAKVTANYYEVTGPWSNPLWKSASRS